MLRQTKIVATLGPATDPVEELDAMIAAGLDVARVNFSHGRAEDHMRRVEMVRQQAQAHSRPIGILADLQGPKIRIESFRDGPVTLTEGEVFYLDPGLAADAGDERRVGVTYQDLPRDVKRDDVLLLDDGNIVLQTELVENDEIRTRVVTGGILSNNKGINRQGGGLSAAALTAKDYEDVKLAGQLDAEYLAVSFARNAEDVQIARELFHAAGGRGGIMAKVERAEAMQNIDEIIDTADSVMIARGDLGVEIGDAELPGVQKRIIRDARMRNRVVITATQMMQSMVEHSQPTRAEVLDVANAVLDGTDAVMLSAETSIGKHPAKVVAAMDRICRGAERHQDLINLNRSIDAHFENTEEAIAMSTMYAASHYDVAAILALTESGATAKWMSRMISGIPIYAVTTHRATQRRVALYRGVYPIDFGAKGQDDRAISREAIAELVRVGAVRDGDRIIITQGDLSGVTGGTNTMRIVRVNAGVY